MVQPGSAAILARGLAPLAYSLVGDAAGVRWSSLAPDWPIARAVAVSPFLPRTLSKTGIPESNADFRDLVPRAAGDAGASNWNT